MSAVVMLYATFGSAEEADRIASALVGERLAACANVLGAVASVYRWRGAVARADEVAMIVKTTEERAEAATRRIVELHGYETPSVVALPVAGGHAAYLDWVRENVA